MLTQEERDVKVKLPRRAENFLQAQGRRTELRNKLRTAAAHAGQTHAHPKQTKQHIPKNLKLDVGQQEEDGGAYQQGERCRFHLGVVLSIESEGSPYQCSVLAVVGTWSCRTQFLLAGASRDEQEWEPSRYHTFSLQRFFHVLMSFGGKMGSHINSGLMWSDSQTLEHHGFTYNQPSVFHLLRENAKPFDVAIL